MIELLQVWMGSERTNGGLGLSTKQTATALASQGIAQLIAIMAVLPLMVKRFGTVHLCRAMCFGFMIVYSIQPWVRYLYDVPDFQRRLHTHFWEVPAAILCIFTWWMFAMTGMTTIIVVLNDVAPRSSICKVNSVADGMETMHDQQRCHNWISLLISMTVISNIVNAIGPAACGVIWSG